MTKNLNAIPIIEDPGGRWTKGRSYSIIPHDDIFGSFNEAFPDQAVTPDDTVWLHTECGIIGFDPSEIEST